MLSCNDEPCPRVQAGQTYQSTREAVQPHIDYANEKAGEVHGCLQSIMHHMSNVDVRVECGCVCPVTWSAVLTISFGNVPGQGKQSVQDNFAAAADKAGVPMPSCIICPVTV